MERKQVKNIIILVLLLVNGFLLILVVSRRSESLRYERAALVQAAQVLKNNGIQADPEELAGAESPPALSVARDAAAESGAVRALLGEDVTEDSSRGGLTRYAAPAGEVTIRSGGELTALLSAEDERWATDDPEYHAAGILRRMGVEAEQTDLTTEGDLTAVTFRQLWQGSPLFNGLVTFTYEDGRLTKIGGDLLFSGSVSSGGAEVLTLPTALLRFLDGVLEAGDVCSSIKSMTPGYRAGQSFSNTTRLSPVWLVSSDTADYYLDAVTGELTRLNVKKAA